MYLQKYLYRSVCYLYPTKTPFQHPNCEMQIFMAPLLYDIKNPLCPTNYAGAVWIEYSTTLGVGNWTLLEKLDPVSRRQNTFFKVQYPIPAGSEFNRTRLVPVHFVYYLVY